MHGIIGFGGYLPYRRLDLSTVAAVAGGGGRKGTRSVAAFDEDATTMAVEAARVARRRAPDVPVESVWFATVAPPYLDKTNATVLQAALRLPGECGAYDLVGSVRGALGALRAAAGQSGPALAVAADLRTGLAGGPDESYFGDGAAALVVGADTHGEVVAELGPWVSVTGEFVDRWRVPGEERSRVWEERFGEVRYGELGADALQRLWKADGHRARRGRPPHRDGPARAGVQSGGAALGRRRRPARRRRDADGREHGRGASLPVAGRPAGAGRGGAHDRAADAGRRGRGDRVAHDRRVGGGAGRGATVSAQIAAGGPVSYGRYLSWRGILPVEPPRRPEPARTSSSAAGRSVPWKFGFEGSRSPDGSMHMPPLPDEGELEPMADTRGTVTTFTIDRLSYTPSPPMVFAVVDFDAGGRLPVELTDVDADQVAVGDRVEMTFRRLSTADGIHNYFWKARPCRGGDD